MTLKPRASTIVEVQLGLEDLTRYGARFVDRTGNPTSYTYKEVIERAKSVAGTLQAGGLAPGDRVAITLPTSIHFLDIFLGTGRAVDRPCGKGRAQREARRGGRRRDPGSGSFRGIPDPLSCSDPRPGNTPSDFFRKNAAGRCAADVPRWRAFASGKDERPQDAQGDRQVPDRMGTILAAEAAQLDLSRGAACRALSRCLLRPIHLPGWAGQALPLHAVPHHPFSLPDQKIAYPPSMRNSSPVW